MKKTLLALLFISAAMFRAEAHTSDNFNKYNCFAVLAGKNATVDGSVLLAHNEDDTGEQMLNIYTVPRNAEKGTNKYIWIEFPGMDVADAALNE